LNGHCTTSGQIECSGGELTHLLRGFVVAACAALLLLLSLLLRQRGKEGSEAEQALHHEEAQFAVAGAELNDVHGLGGVPRDTQPRALADIW
jgi:hypothetical protein